MAKKLSLLLVAGVFSVLLPAAAWAGNAGTGACFVVTGEPVWPAGDSADPEGKFSLAGCADGFTEQECSSVAELTEFWRGVTCEDVAQKGGFEWEGSCEASIDPIGTTCIQLWTEIGGTATEAVCINEVGGSWFDDLECGGTPVPTMPPLGLAAMMLLMLGGALVLLTMRSRRAAV